MAGDRRTGALLCVCTLTEEGFCVPGTYLGKHESLPFLASTHGRGLRLQGTWPELRPASW